MSSPSIGSRRTTVYAPLGRCLSRRLGIRLTVCPTLNLWYVMDTPASQDAMRARRPAAGSDSLQVLRRKLALLALLDLVADLLALVQVADPRPLDRGDVHEDILRPVIRLDEAVALLGVEPFDGACRHRITPRHRRPAPCEPDYSSGGRALRCDNAAHSHKRSGSKSADDAIYRPSSPKLPARMSNGWRRGQMTARA